MLIKKSIKRFLFRWRCLINIAVVAISTSSVVVAEGIDDVRSELNQIYGIKSVVRGSVR